MLQARFKSYIEPLREGINAGLIAGLIILFLILLGIPVNIPNLALFSLLLVMALFGSRLARRLHKQGLAHVLGNAVAMGVAAALIAFLFMSVINRWQARGIDVKRYFDAISMDTMTVLSGVPKAELAPNDEPDPLTGVYDEDAYLRTNPMRMTFDSDTGLHLKLGLAGSSWMDINLVIGGFYGFLLVLFGVGLLSAAITWAMVEGDVGRYRKQLGSQMSGNPVSHWLVLLMPLLAFALLWLTEGQGPSFGPVLSSLGDQSIQLLIAFLVILAGLVALREAQQVGDVLDYPVRTAICLGAIALMVAVGIWRIVDSKAYFAAISGDPDQSRWLSVMALAGLGILVAAQNIWSLRRPGRFETQLAGTLAFFAVALMPLYLDQYQNEVMTIVGINILMGLGLNIVVGYAGLLDLGYVAFFALGAYAYAFLSSQQLAMGADNQPVGFKFAGNTEMVSKMANWIVITVIITLIVVYVGVYLWRQYRTAVTEASRALIHAPALPGRGTTILLTLIAVGTSLGAATVLDRSNARLFGGASPFLVGLIVGTIVAGLSGIALGIPVLRLRGDYLAIVTLGFGEIIRLLFTNLSDYTGGPRGVLQIPRPIPSDAPGAVTYLWMVYLVFMGAGLVAFFSMRLRQSRIGRAWSAMRSDEDIAQAMGINLVQSKLMAFAIGAAFAGIGGVLFAARQRNIYPNDFKLDVSIEVLSLVIIGGMGSIPGVIMGAIALIGVPEVLRELATYRILVFGALLITMVIVRPSGLLPAPMSQFQDRARLLVHGRPRQPESEGEGS